MSQCKAGLAIYLADLVSFKEIERRNEVVFDARLWAEQVKFLAQMLSPFCDTKFPCASAFLKR